MRQSQLRAFHNVALHGGFSRAADALRLSQPAVSEQVRKLEQEHDVLLFHRERRRVKLTAEGERLFALTKQYFDVEEQIEAYMSETRTAVDGTLRIIADSAHHVTDILGRFRARYPKVFVTLRTGNSAEVVEALRAYDAEIGVVDSLAPGSDMTVMDLGASQIVAFAARGLLPEAACGFTLQELTALPLVFREQGSRTRQKLEAEAARQRVRLSPAIEVEGREAMREVVASGAGVGFVSRAEFGNDDRLVEIPLKGADIRMPETLVCMTQRREVKVIRAFMDFAGAASGAEAQSPSPVPTA
ncbi:LysR family transcriptional regulator [Rhodobacteraceae bacterium NNCM2]|nr:LysR family transcriptional regulator [Coraliihabitans acroporae]